MNKSLAEALSVCRSGASGPGTGRRLATWTLAAVLLPTSVWAACTDVPGPGVDLRRCQFLGQEIGALDFSEGELRDASFNRSLLDGARFVNAEGRGASFVSTSLKGADFTASDFRRADFTKADLTGANFAGADLRSGRLFRAILREANLTGARLTGTDLVKADFSGATWTDGLTICAEGSIGQCRPAPAEPAQAADAPGTDELPDAAPPTPASQETPSEGNPS